MEYGPEVYGLLTRQLDPGVMPHFFIVKTLGDYAVANRMTMMRSYSNSLSLSSHPSLCIPLALHFIPNCREIFGRLVAMMGMIKHDNLRWVFSAGKETLKPPSFSQDS